MTINQIKSFSNAVATWVVNGLKVTPDDIREHRYNLCQACPEFDKDGFMGHGKCNLCGCNLRVKTVFPYEKCPVDKWGKVEVGNATG